MSLTYRSLGRSGLKVSPLCLGMLQFGLTADADEGRRVLDSAREIGVNFLDTANVYALGESERITGRLIAGERERWVLATKAGIAIGPGPYDAGLSRKALLKSIDESLRRLATDYVDLFYFHVPDDSTPFEESILAATAIVQSGKARYWGLSNFLGWQIAAIVRRCDELGVPRPIVNPPNYNLVDRLAEADILTACEFYGLGVAVYSPLARGILTGKYAPGQLAAADSRVGRKEKRMMDMEYRAESLAVAAKVAAHAGARGINAAQFSTAWVLNNRIVTTVVAGPRTLAQWNDYAAALAYRFTAEDETFADSLVPAGHYSTPQHNDPIWPPMGRVPYRGERLIPIAALPPTPARKP
jgi:aryl-alcohol dehydrogenase-like predicted oxidoreductase